MDLESDHVESVVIKKTLGHLALYIVTIRPMLARAWWESKNSYINSGHMVSYVKLNLKVGLFSSK